VLLKKGCNCKTFSLVPLLFLYQTLGFVEHSSMIILDKNVNEGIRRENRSTGTAEFNFWDSFHILNCFSQQYCSKWNVALLVNELLIQKFSPFGLGDFSQTLYIPHEVESFPMKSMLFMCN
jgi:hypothetical protein